MNTRVKTGIAGFDQMLGGGLNPGSVAIIKGAPGAGKTCFGIEFLARGVEKFNEKGLYVTFEEFSEQIYRDAASLGFGFQALKDSGQIFLLFISPEVFVNQLTAPGGEFDQLILKNDIKRIVVDSISIVLDVLKPANGRDFVYSFVNGLRRHRTTSLLTKEDASLFGDTTFRSEGLSFISDTLVQLKYVEIASTLERAIVVIKHRATKHDNRIHSFTITDHGVVIGKPFAGKEGILSGSPRDIMKRVEDFYR